MTIHVTQAHIDNRYYEQPIMAAICDATGQDWGLLKTVVSDPWDNDYSLPQAVIFWLDDYRSGRFISPIAFELIFSPEGFIK